MPFLLIGIAVLLLVFVVSSQSNATGATVTSCNITNDPNTWPSGDTVWTVCHAIAHAEGADVAGSNPDRLNNPGDISDYAETYGFEVHSGSNVTKFPDKKTGWEKLYEKISNAFVSCTSSCYSPNMTWNDFAQKYAGDWRNWVANVTGPLGVTPDERVGDYFGN